MFHWYVTTLVFNGLTMIYCWDLRGFGGGVVERYNKPAKYFHCPVKSKQISFAQVVNVMAKADTPQHNHTPKPS